MPGLWSQGPNEEKLANSGTLLTSDQCKICWDSINSCDLRVLSEALRVNIIHSCRAKVTCWMPCCTWLWFDAFAPRQSLQIFDCFWKIPSLSTTPLRPTRVVMKLQSHPRLLLCIVPVWISMPFILQAQHLHSLAEMKEI